LEVRLSRLLPMSPVWIRERGEYINLISLFWAATKIDNPLINKVRRNLFAFIIVWFIKVKDC